MTLTDIAIVGTARAKEAPSTGTAIDALVGAVSDAPIERRVLLAAGAFDVFRRAGRLPARVAQLPPPAPADHRPACGEGATGVLREMLNVHPGLLVEAFALLDRAGLRLPSTLLVATLELADKALRYAAHPVLGTRGQWLAGHRPDWSWAHRTGTTTDLDEMQRVWQEGRLDERLAVIARLRAVQPDVAREWVAAVWPREKADVRLELVSALDAQLSTADEEWLMVALRDRTAAVRGTAAALLARLPGSQVAARAAARADDYLAWTASSSGPSNRKVEGGSTPGDTLHVTPPLAVDPAWESDGLIVKPPRGSGERAFWLTQALSLVDPGHWSSRFPASPADLARAAWTSEWGAAVMTGWSRAAVLHGATAWIVALWDAWVAHEDAGNPSFGELRREVLLLLLDEMPDREAEQRVATLLRQPPLAGALDIEEALERFPAPWSEGFGLQVLETVERELASAQASSALLPALLRAAGPALPSSLLGRASTLTFPGPVQIPPGLARELDLFITRVRLRRRLHQEISQ